VIIEVARHCEGIHSLKLRPMIVTPTAARMQSTGTPPEKNQHQEVTMSKTSLLSGTVLAFVLPLAFAFSTGAAMADCKSGYVYRDAKDGDGVCVTPGDRAEAKKQNANAENNRRVGGGNYGPNTCRDGYVWRDAFAGDVVCVTPFERQKAAQQNAASPGHTN
jgi:hypothetical protein